MGEELTRGLDDVFLGLGLCQGPAKWFRLYLDG